MAVIQVRIDDSIKNEAAKIYEELGLDVSSAIRMFLKKSVEVRGIPFDVRLKYMYKKVSDEEVLKALNSLREESHKNGTDKLTLDDINKEIDAYRKEKAAKEK